MSDLQRIFLFSAYELSPIYDETANQIPDPIVTVDTGNLAASVYYSIMTRNMFLIRHDAHIDTGQWQAKLVDSGIRELIQTITPVYDQRAAQLRQHEQRVFFLYQFTRLNHHDHCLCLFKL